MTEKTPNVVAMSQSVELKSQTEGMTISEGGAPQLQVERVDAMDLSHRELNARLRKLVSNGTQRIELHNVYGQRYIGTDLNKHVEIY